VSVRGLLFFIVAIAVGAGVGVGGYWVYDTYFPSPARALEKAQQQFDKAEQAFANDPAAAEPLYQEVVAQLDKLADRSKADDMAVNVPAYLLRAKTMWKLGRVAEEREKKQGPSKEAAADRSKYFNAALGIYQDMLAKYDKDNIDAGNFLLEYWMGADEVGRAEIYAEVVARYQLKEGEKPTKEGNARQATAHYLLAQRALRASNPKPDEALAHVRAIAALPAPEGVAKDKRWRELGTEAQALKMRLDMANKRMAEGAVPLKGVVREEIAAELNATIAGGIAKAQKDLGATLPADDKHPAIPVLATLNATNTRGVLDFLTTAIAASAIKADLVQRVDLLLAVCQQLLEVPKPPEATVKAVGSHLANLPAVVEKPAAELKKPDLRLLAADWSPLEGRLRDVIERAQAAGAPVDPDVWLELARKANRERRWGDAEKSAKKGLELARKRGLGTDYASVRNLHREAAWSLFGQNKASAAEEHLTVVRKEPGLARTAFLIDGLNAVRDGRLEVSARNLLAAQQDPQYARSLLPVMGLARAYEGLGQYERALAMLAKLDAAYEKYEQLSEEERTLASELFPSADAVALEAMRCRLSLNQIEAALVLAKRLEPRPLGAAARILLVNYYLAAGRAELAKDNPFDARDAFDAARKVLKAAPDEQRAAPALVWADALLTASQPDRSRPSDAQASVGLPKAGPSNVEKAEQLLKDYAAKRPDSIDGHLLWVRWLESRQRYDEADRVLTDMAKHFADHAKVIDAVRARLALVRARDGEIGQLVASLRGTSDDRSLDVLQLLYLTSQEGGEAKPPTAVGAALGPHYGTVLFHLWNGARAQQAGRFEDAARSYGRALAPSRYQAEAQVGLLASLLGLAAKDSPTTAAKLVDELRGDNPTDPVLLLAHAEMARQGDNIQGRDSMEAALAMLERVLAPLNRQAVAVDLLARGYYAAGRPDLARTEAGRALQLDTAYAPALVLAARAAAEAEDYAACLRYAEELERALYGTPAAKRMAAVVGAPRSVLDRPQPTLADGLYWRAAASEHLGRKDEAKRAYQQLIDKQQGLATGYLGLAGLRARAKDFTGALDAVRQWRAKDPKDAAGAAAEVRLLAQSGKTAEAERAGEAFAGSNPAALLTVARAFADAMAYDLAEAWGRRAVQAAKDKADVVAAQLVVGDACRARASSREGDARKADVEKALTAYKAVWVLAPGNPAAGYPLAALQATDPDQAGAAYAIVQDARKGRHSGNTITGDRLTLEQLGILGDVYRLSKHAGEAITAYREAVKRYPREPRLLLPLGRIYRDQNMRGDAAAVLTEAQIAALERADAATDPDGKARWQAVADEAKGELAKLDGKR
jgi:hypothetical protein